MCLDAGDARARCASFGAGHDGTAMCSKLRGEARRQPLDAARRCARSATRRMTVALDDDGDRRHAPTASRAASTYDPPFMGMKPTPRPRSRPGTPAPARPARSPATSRPPPARRSTSVQLGASAEASSAPPHPPARPRRAAPRLPPAPVFRRASHMRHNLFDSFQSFPLARGGSGQLYSLPALEAAGLGKISRLPVSIRIVLESVLRNCDGKKVTEEHVRELASWKPNAERTDEIPFVVARVVLQDFTGVPLLADLAAMRNVAHDLGTNPKTIEPLVPGRPRRRPLGDDRPLRHEGRARPQHEARVPAQRRALPVHEVGHAGVRHVQGRARRASASSTRSTSSTWRAACT